MQKSICEILNVCLNNISHDHFYLKNKSKLNIKIVEKEKKAKLSFGFWFFGFLINDQCSSTEFVNNFFG